MDSEIIVDNFLSDFDSFRVHCDNVNYDGIINPADNVFYPGVSLDIPKSVQAEVVSQVISVMGRDIKVNAMFLRLRTKGVQEPHQAHTDAIMGKYSLMLYMNRVEDCEGGTSLVLHKNTGLNQNPINQKQLDVWEKDKNSPEEWQICKMTSMTPNRAYIFDSNLMHRAEPLGGFGNNEKNGRLLLTMFYD
jgi:hypothetical protein